MEYNTPRQMYGATQAAAGYDAGLRAHMLRTYNYIGIGLAISAFTAFLTANIPGAFAFIFSAGWGTVIQLAPLAILFFLMFKANSMSRNGLLTSFWVFAAMKGVALSYIFALYGMGDITRALLITAAVFGGMSLYGYNTKRDLTGLGFFLMAGVWALFLSAMVVLGMSLFGIATGAAGFVISSLLALVVVGLTAYETQQLKNSYYQLSGEMLDKISILTALNLYINIIIIFQYVLRFMGNRE